MQRRRRLILTLDAFGTLFTPKIPINQQYANVAKDLEMRHVDPVKLKGYFKQAFETENRLHPNYGAQLGMTNRQWWHNVINGSFSPFVTSSNPLPRTLPSRLYDLFGTAEAYRLFDDVLPFFQDVRDHKLRAAANAKKSWEWDDIVVGIISNSDSRIFNVLDDFGINIVPRFVGASTLDHQALQDSEDLSFLALSCNVGHVKPDPAIFDAAKSYALALADGPRQNAVSAHDSNQLGSSQAFGIPYETVFCHVGDEMEADIILESEAGWHTVKLDRQVSLGSSGRFRQLEKSSIGPFSFEGQTLRAISQGLFDPTNASTYDAA